MSTFSPLRSIHARVSFSILSASTFVAARVPGQVVRVLVDDDNRVRKGALLVQLDKEPYQVKVDIEQAALTVTQADIVTTQAKVRGLESLARSPRFDPTNAVQNLNNQVADLHCKVLLHRRLFY